MKRGGTGRILSPAQYEELLDHVYERDQKCFFADSIPHACDGYGEAAHLIEQSKLKSYATFGLVLRSVKQYNNHPEDSTVGFKKAWVPQSRVDVFDVWDEKMTLVDLARDPRNVVYACSFIHRIFDARFYRHKPLEFPRALLDPRFEMYVNEFNLERLAAARFPVHLPDDFNNPLGIEQESINQEIS